jgi:ribosomal protein S18 acetylase RimI-like enzyme
MNATIDIRFLKDNELESARVLLVESFTQDPTMDWMLQKNEEGFDQRVKMHVELGHQSFIDAKMPIIGAWVNDDLRGVLYGGSVDNDHMQEADYHFKEKAKTMFTGTALKRIMDFEESMSDEMLPNSYFIALVAVAKHARGRGIGSALIKHVMAMCKQDETIDNIMLDTGNSRNIELYERLGFKSTAIKAFDENFLQTVMVYSLRKNHT